MNLDVAHRCRPCAGETRAGDAVVVRVDDETNVLALIDVLGHGPRAADAADRAAEFLRTTAVHEGVRAMLEGLHRLLHASRGAAATICLLNPRGLEACGVGNVGVRVYGSPASIVPSPGVIGGRMRQLRTFKAELQPNTRILLYSDGIRPEFSEREARLGSPAESCDVILQRHARPDDDATILIADLP